MKCVLWLVWLPVIVFAQDKEAALGKQLAAAVEREHALLEDAATVAYLNQLGTQLARASEMSVPL